MTNNDDELLPFGYLGHELNQKKRKMTDQVVIKTHKESRDHQVE